MAQASPTTEEYTNTVVRHLQDESMVAFHHLKLSCRLKGCDRTHPYALPIICCKNCENERIESITQLRKERKQQFEEAVKKHRQEKGTLHDEMDNGDQMQGVSGSAFASGMPRTSTSMHAHPRCTFSRVDFPKLGCLIMFSWFGAERQQNKDYKTLIAHTF